MLRLIRNAVLATLGVAALSACANSAPREPCPAGQRCLYLGNSGEPFSLDPAKSTTVVEDRILSDMLVGLTQDDAAGRPIPGMATSWETSPDGLTWTFHLRRDARWSDGVPVTADDFVYALRRLMDPRSASEYAYILYVVQNGEQVNQGRMPLTQLGVQALDAHTLQYRLEHPAPYFLELAKHHTMLPVPRHVVERYGDAWVQPGHFVSNGPYTLVSWRLGNRVRVQRNPLYWDNANVCFDRVDYFPTIDSVAAERRVRNGEIDSNSDVSSSRMPRLQREIPNYVRVHTYVGSSYLIFNNRVPAFRDRRVRQAITMSIDREFVTRRLLADGKRPAYSFVPPGIANYAPPTPPEWSRWPFARRQAYAADLMRQAGYTPEHPLELTIYQASNPDSALVMQSIQSDLAPIGVRLRIQQQEGQVTYAAYRARNFQIGSAGWIADFNDASNFLDLLRSTTGAQNYGDYNNPRYDALMHAADHEPNAARRADYMRQAEALMLSEYAIAPLYFQVNKNLVNPRLTGWVDNIVDHHRARWLCTADARTRVATATAGPRG
jgi:oligopeptide transport system substrate-binding protein